jgi:hypothetical protein
MIGEFESADRGRGKHTKIVSGHKGGKKRGRRKRGRK